MAEAMVAEVDVAASALAGFNHTSAETEVDPLRIEPHEATFHVCRPRALLVDTIPGNNVGVASTVSFSTDLFSEENRPKLSAHSAF